MRIQRSDEIRSLTGIWLSKLVMLIQGNKPVHNKLQSFIIIHNTLGLRGAINVSAVNLCKYLVV